MPAYSPAPRITSRTTPAATTRPHTSLDCLGALTIGSFFPPAAVAVKKMDT